MMKENLVEIKGYKAFDANRTNRYGVVFEEGKTYTVDGELKIGLRGNGYHFCSYLSDVFRYVDARELPVTVAVVTSGGKRIDFNDEYYGYYDMHVASTITIDRFLSRKEIIEHMIQRPDFECIKFFQTFRLNAEERMLFIDKYVKDDNKNMLNYLAYYQLDCEDAFDRKENNLQEILLKKYPQ